MNPFEDFLKFLLILLSVWVFVAMLVKYIMRWHDNENSTSTAALWPIAVMMLLWDNLIVLPIVRVAHFVDRRIYLHNRHKIDESEYGILWEGRMPYGRHVEVEVQDSTGKYLIPVSPRYDLRHKYIDANDNTTSYGDVMIKTARQAVEWSYGLYDGELNPVIRR